MELVKHWNFLLPGKNAYIELEQDAGIRRPRKRSNHSDTPETQNEE